MRSTGSVATVMFFVFFSIASFLSLQGCSKQAPAFNTDYQAVFMDNGQVFFGKVENAGDEYALLHDVYYIGRQQSPDGKDVKNILIKRGNEWHKPDSMSINRQHIVMIEPVASDSRVAQLIKEARNQKPQPTQQ